MKKSLIIVLAVVGVIAIAGFKLMGDRNRLVEANEDVNAKWSQVDIVLQRRSDLIPNLVNTVKGYAKQESDIFIKIAEARARLSGAKTVNDKIAANQSLDGALARLLVVVEQYPQLKSNENFMSLQDELAGTENRIAVERMRYNESIKTYNLLVQRFPSNIAARLFNYDKKEAYFTAEESSRTVPPVQF